MWLERLDGDKDRIGETIQQIEVGICLRYTAGYRYPKEYCESHLELHICSFNEDSDSTKGPTDDEKLKRIPRRP